MRKTLSKKTAVAPPPMPAAKTKSKHHPLELREEYVRLFDSGLSHEQAANQTGIPRNTGHGLTTPPGRNKLKEARAKIDGVKAIKAVRTDWKTGPSPVESNGGLPTSLEAAHHEILRLRRIVSMVVGA